MRPEVALAVFLAGAVASLTDWIGLQTIVGAFAFDLLPLYFVLTGRLESP